MGLMFLPWEYLPAYVVGPLLSAVSVALFVIGGPWPPSWNWLGELLGFAGGIWLTWTRWKTGEEPLWTEERRARKRAKGR